jgi:hypothetical protein
MDRRESPQQSGSDSSHHPAEETPELIAPPVVLARPLSVTTEACDPVVRRYRAFFGVLDWSVVVERDAGRPWPGQAPPPRSAYIKAYVANRHDPERHTRGDPDCRLGVKRSTNQEHADGRTTVHKEVVWGYGTGLVSATDRRYGEVVLAEVTQPFNEHAVTCSHPLHRQAVATLGQPPTNVTADAAFDAWHVDQTWVETGGIAAIPLNLRGQAPPERDDQGRPRCAKGLTMVPRYQFTHEDGYRVQRSGCPLLVPTPTHQSWDHPPFRSGSGCVIGIDLEPGGMMRATLDRHTDAYKAIYRQRTSAERINSQATALGIERPRVRHAQSVHRLNTLTYIVINARALQRARALNAARPTSLPLC